MEVLTVARIQGQWHGWIEEIGEWLPLPLTPEASNHDVETFYAGRGTKVRIASDRDIQHFDRGTDGPHTLSHG